MDALPHSIFVRNVDPVGVAPRSKYGFESDTRRLLDGGHGHADAFRYQLIWNEVEQSNLLVLESLLTTNS